jgi:hypothetical protein
MEKVETKKVNSKQLYIGSAIAVTTGMAIIKGLATVVNKTVAFLMENVT